MEDGVTRIEVAFQREKKEIQEINEKNYKGIRRCWIVYKEK